MYANPRGLSVPLSLTTYTLSSMTHVSPISVIGLRRAIADKVIAAEKYVC